MMQVDRERLGDNISCVHELSLFVAQIGGPMRQLVTTPGQVGEILRGRRRARGVPQQELATKLGISQSRLLDA